MSATGMACWEKIAGAEINNIQDLEFKHTMQFNLLGLV